MRAITEGNIVALELNKWVGDVYGMSSSLQVHTMHPNYGRIKQNEISISIQEYECAILRGGKRCQRGKYLASAVKNGTN